MNGGIYLIQDNGDLVEMRAQPYDSEDLLQGLLAQYPHLLAGDQMDGISARRWLLVSREAPIPVGEEGPGWWSVDHVFLDQDAVPTLVEVKRSTDTRIRREVVGQMLDYAANAVLYWPVAELRARFSETCNARGIDASQALADFLEPGMDPEAFWRLAEANLRAGRIRLLFIADEIPGELRRVVEFLNERMQPTEVLAVEVKQYAGQSLRTLVPRLIGYTAEGQRKAAGARETRQWDEDSFMAELRARRGPVEVGVAKGILQWARARELRLWWGNGARDGSFFPVLDHRGQGYTLVCVWTYGRIEVQFQWLKTRPPFDDEGKRAELLGRLNAVEGVSIAPDAIGRRPSIPLGVLSSEGVLKQAMEVLDWTIDQIRDATP